jgi:acyl-CoA thioesterase-1
VNPLRLLVGAALSCIAAGAVSPPAPAGADDRSYVCADRDHLGHLSSPLMRMRRLVFAGRAVTIMALGSSSTAGAGASTPKASYPAQLEAYLRSRFPSVSIKVINRGVNGEEASDMLQRFAKAVSDDKPDVVLWQLGTNSVLRNQSIGVVDGTIAEGLIRMKELGIDVVLIDPQFAPAVLGGKRDAAERMVRLIEAASMNRSVDLFRRFQVMREWHEAEAIPFDVFLSPDLLHMNDWGYACFAKLLGAAMAEAVTRPVASIGKPPEQ